jgi:microcystin-dependent protein
LLFLFCSIYSQAQVGINNSNPDANSILDLNSTNKGLLIPRMLTAQRESMVSLKPAQGMMVYDTQLDVIFIFYSNKWYALNPWKTDYRTYNDSSASSMTAMFGGSTNYGNIGIGVDIPTEKFQVNGKIKATEFIGNGATPLGGIILWSGTIAPTGWALCDGDTANGYTTPNLKNRFVVGYNPSDWRYDWPGNLSQKGTSTSDIGGAATVALNLSQMPRHNHGVTDPKHKHQTTVTSVFGQGCTDNDDCERHFYNSRTTVFKYSSSVKTGVTIKDAGDDAAHENRPPYYTLAYIMRVY